MKSKSISSVALTLVGAFIITTSTNEIKVSGLSTEQIIPAEEDPAVTRFREYLQINSSHPTPDYESCIQWLRNQADDIGLDFHLERYEESEIFAVWLTWNGTNSSLKSILFDSHMDVVAVDPSKWDYDPFEAYKDENGNIFARGSIDMKSTTVSTLEAIRRLKNLGFVPLRNIHVAVLPDEELYSRGVKAFVNSSNFANLNIGFAIDEGMFSGTEDMLITYAEKSVWQFTYVARGIPSHASTLPRETAGQKIQVVIDRLMEFRANQLSSLEDPDITMENVTSLNLVKLGGGLGNNIIPDELWAQFDMRIVTKPNWTLTDVDNMLNGIAEEAGDDVSINFLVKSMDSEQTPTDDSNIWWVVIQQTCNQFGIRCTPNIPTGVTDGRYIRNTGIPLFGLNPFPNTVSMAHQDNEHINENNFLLGIQRMEVFISNIASVSANESP